jgi:hypothetical protein
LRLIANGPLSKENGPSCGVIFFFLSVKKISRSAALRWKAPSHSSDGHSLSEEQLAPLNGERVKLPPESSSRRLKTGLHIKLN